MIQIYSHPLVQNYRASICSFATLFQFGSVLLTIICPLLVAYRSQGFWIRTNVYQEHPKVSFMHQYIFMLRSNQVNRYWLWSSYDHLNSLETDKLRIPYLTAYETDTNGDGLSDVMELTARFPMNKGEEIISARAILIFHYSLDLYSRFRMQGMIDVEKDSHWSGSGMDVLGDISLSQRIPLWYRGRDRRFDQNPINETSHYVRDFDFRRIQEEYFRRNVTIKLDPQHVHWQPTPNNVPKTFKIQMKINYKMENVEYYCGFWELIKWGWVQYLSILLIFIFIMASIRQFVFQNRLVKAIPLIEH